MARMDRREFIGMAAGAAVLPSRAAPEAAKGRPPAKGRLLRFGVLSDVHISLYSNSQQSYQAVHMEKALRWFDSQGVDAVVFPGDMIHSGIVSEMEIFAKVWHLVFPGGRGSDGRTVEKVLVTGNHEIAMWQARIDHLGQREWDEKEGLALRIEETWERLFGEKYEKVFMKKIKGVTFVGAQFHSCKPPVEEFFRDHADDLPKDRPFFYVQHAHPANTCYGFAKTACDHGESTRALSPFPWAIALTGHSHTPLTDDRSVWQGAFTSIGCGSAWNAGDNYPEGHDNATQFNKPQYSNARMESVWKFRDGYDSGRSCMLVDVYPDHLDIARRSIDFAEPLGPDWRVPLPAMPGGPFDFARGARETKPPEFEKDAYITFFPGWKYALHPKIGRRLRDKPYVGLMFPTATAGEGRVYDYVVEASVGGKTLAVSKLLTESQPFPPRLMQVGEACLFGRDELAEGVDIDIAITPRNCYGVSGRPLKTVVRL